MHLFQILILSVIEGLTEFLPISSTAHLMIFSKLLSLEPTEFLKTFEIVIQLGAISAVLFLYFKKIFSNFGLIKKIAIGFLPTGITGLFFYSLFKFWLGRIDLALAMLFIGGAFLVLLEKFFKEKNKTEISLKDAFLIGCGQTLAMIPGVSRALATIISGMFLGYSRKTAVEFSFLLALPTMLGAVSLDLYKNYSLFSFSDWRILGLGFSLAFLSALFGVKFLLRLIQKNNFLAFGWYRMAFALLMFLIFF
ncbi:MAG: undecaprenyl-diphosphate phosphatase [Patescibacteria group bacterium]